jgi:hypothetical protein
MAALLFYDPFPQFFYQGSPLSGGTLTFRPVGDSSSLKDIYTDSAMGTALPNPISLNSDGYPQNASLTACDIYLNGAYDVTLKTSAGATIRTVSNVTAIGMVTKTRAVSSTPYTVVAADNGRTLLVDASGGNITVNLMAAATAGDGFKITVAKIDNSANTVTLSGTINSGSSYIMAGRYDAVTVVSNATQYYATDFIGTVVDNNGNPLIKYTAATNGVAYILVTNAATGNAAKITGAGETNSGLILDASGSGVVTIGSGSNTITLAKATTVSSTLALNGTTTLTAAAINAAKGADIASATTADIGATTGNFVDVTGTTTITGLGTVQAGTTRQVRFTGALTLTHNATSLILPVAQNITTANGDLATFISLGSGNWLCSSYFIGTTPINAKYVQTQIGTSATYTNVSTVMPIDDTIPQLTEGAQILTVSITPKSTANILEIQAIIQGRGDGTNGAGMALFQDSTANALNAAVLNGSGTSNTGVLLHRMSAGTTSSTTFTVRVGPAAGNYYVNGSSSARLFGGVQFCSIIVKEYTV